MVTIHAHFDGTGLDSELPDPSAELERKTRKYVESALDSVHAVGWSMMVMVMVMVPALGADVTQQCAVSWRSNAVSFSGLGVCT
jgi:hypothetical protein